MKVFISQPMKDKTQEEIETRRKEIIETIRNRYLNDNIEFIYSVIEEQPNANVQNIPVWYLAKSIDMLSTATLTYFDEGWENARGCRIEHRICEDYGIQFIDYINLFTKEKE